MPLGSAAIWSCPPCETVAGSLSSQNRSYDRWYICSVVVTCGCVVLGKPVRCNLLTRMVSCLARGHIYTLTGHRLRRTPSPYSVHTSSSEACRAGKECSDSLHTCPDSRSVDVLQPVPPCPCSHSLFMLLRTGVIIWLMARPLWLRVLL